MFWDGGGGSEGKKVCTGGGAELRVPKLKLLSAYARYICDRSDSDLL